MNGQKDSVADDHKNFARVSIWRGAGSHGLDACTEVAAPTHASAAQIAKALSFVNRFLDRVLRLP